MNFRLLLAVLWMALPARATPDPRDTDRPYGVLDFLGWYDDWSHRHSDPEKVKQSAVLMKEAGVVIVRQDITWEDVEPQQGTFDFSKFDGIVNALEDQGVKVTGLLGYSPKWNGKTWNAAPDPELYVKYAVATVHHFKDRIRYWEIWNEPDSKTYWVPQDGLTAYSALLKAVYPAIKKEDPTAMVVVGGMTETGAFALRNVYRKAGQKYFDVVNIHPFADPLKPTAVQTLHGIYYSLARTMKEFGDQKKPIWFTEIGCPGVVNPTKENAWWHGPSPTEDQQAAWVKTVYSQMLQWPGVDKIFWAFFRDTDYFHNGVDHFGLVREDFSKKPAYETFKTLATNSDVKN